MGKTTWQISKETEDLNNALNQLDLTDIYRTLQQTTSAYTSFPNAHGTFTRLDYMLDYKISLNKFKSIEVIQSMLPDQNGLKLEIKKKKIWGIHKCLEKQHTLN